jgi:hypothetical protein
MSIRDDDDKPVSHEQEIPQAEARNKSKFNIVAEALKIF